VNEPKRDRTSARSRVERSPLPLLSVAPKPTPAHASGRYEIERVIWEVWSVSVRPLAPRPVVRRCRPALSGRAMRRRRGYVFKRSCWGVERTATRSPDPPRSPRSGSGTTNAPTAPRNRDCSRVLTRRCRRAQETPRPRNRCDAQCDSRNRWRPVKGCREPLRAVVTTSSSLPRGPSIAKDERQASRFGAIASGAAVGRREHYQEL
jgi:hypothetical protein